MGMKPTLCSPSLLNDQEFREGICGSFFAITRCERSPKESSWSLVENLKLLEAWSANAHQDFRKIATFSTPRAGTILFEEEQYPTCALLVLKGQVRLYFNSSDGKRFFLRIARAGEFIGLNSIFTGSPYQMVAEAEYCIIASTPRSAFLDFIERYPPVWMSLCHQLSRQADQACLRLRTLGLAQCTTSKLARLIVEWCADGYLTQHGIRIHLPLTHGEIGECIGASRETITRILGELQRRNMIQMRGTVLTIIDRSALDNCAGF